MRDKFEHSLISIVRRGQGTGEIPMADKVILRINNLHVSIEDTEILRGLDLEIKAGEIHALMGLSLIHI